MTRQAVFRVVASWLILCVLLEHVLAQSCPAPEKVLWLSKNCDTALKQKSWLVTVVATPANVVDPRIPTLPRTPAAMPQACKSIVSNTVSAWREEDLCQWERLSNHYCSHQLGWVEKVPGTCQAGGPPPICVADHWRHSPSEALQRLNDDVARVRSAREKELPAKQRAACSCWAKQINSEIDKGTLIRTESPRKPQGAPAAFPATCNISAQCLPGYLCYESKCYQKGAWSNTAAAAADVAKPIIQDLGRDALIEAVLVDLGISVEVASRVTSYGVAMFFPATPIDLGQSSYRRHLRSYEIALEKAKSLLTEISQFYAGKPARGAQQIKADIISVEKQMEKEFDLLNDFAHKTSTEGEIKDTNCPAVFDAMHRQIATTHVRTLDKIKSVTKKLD